MLYVLTKRITICCVFWFICWTRQRIHLYCPLPVTILANTFAIIREERSKTILLLNSVPMILNLNICSVIEQLGGKQLVMQLLSHEDPNVRYEALLAVQKLMVHNWWVLFVNWIPDRALLRPIFVTGNTLANNLKRIVRRKRLQVVQRQYPARLKIFYALKYVTYILNGESISKSKFKWKKNYWKMLSKRIWCV